MPHIPYFCKMGNKPNIRELKLEKLTEVFVSNGEKAFRAKQVWDWFWKKPVRSFEQMSNLSKETRQFLTDNFSIDAVEIADIQKSKDKTRKVNFKLFDGNIVEGVLIPSKTRLTACISSQVGCPLACEFCATGKFGFIRNLNFYEIYDQFVILNEIAAKSFDSKISNIVYMGMGEPLLNYENVRRSIEKLTADDGLAMSPTRITVSTVGIPKMIKKIADDEARYNLAISLHTANDEKRSELMPINNTHPIHELIDSLKYYHSKTNNRITVEYILFGNLNDREQDSSDLAAFCKNFPVKINIIEYNQIDNSEYKKPHPEKVKAFVEFLESKNIIVNLRASKGNDIAAACGQLANKYYKKNAND